MPIHIRVKLRRIERAVELITFQLGHIDAIGGETTHGLEQSGGHIAHLKHKAGD